MLWRNQLGVIQPQRDQFDFQAMDTAMQQAKNASMKADALHLLWGYRGDLPTWLVEGDFSREELRQIMKVHIQTVVGRYRSGSDHGRFPSGVWSTGSLSMDPMAAATSLWTDWRMIRHTRTIIGRRKHFDGRTRPTRRPSFS